MLQEWNAKRKAYSEAVRRGVAAFDVSEEYEYLRRKAEQARWAAVEAQMAFQRHVFEHGCGRAQEKV